MIIPIILLSICIMGCSSNNDNSTIISSSNVVSKHNVNDYELIGYESSIKENEVINPGMGFYKTKYLSLKREMGKIDHDFKVFDTCHFFHIRIDLSDFVGISNGDKDYDITDSAKEALDYYFTHAKINNCNLIIRFAYDKFEGNSNMEPSISMIKSHIKALSTVINDYSDVIIAIECGLIGPWGEMHTSNIANQETYNELLNEWLNDVNVLPILARRPSFIYKYYGYTIDNLDEFNLTDSRLGMYNDGYYGNNLDTGTYDNLSSREKEVKFLNKLNNLSGGECIGNPFDSFSFENVINEMKNINLTYLNSEWNNNIIESWKELKINGKPFYTYMVNHMGFKLYIDSFNYKIENGALSLDINIGNMGFSHITRDLKVELILSNGISTKKSLTDLNNNVNLTIYNLSNNSSVKIYLKITDNLNRSYELMNGTFVDNSNYLGEIKIYNINK